MLVGAYKECEVVYKIVPFHTDPAIKMWAIDFFLIGKFKFSKPSPIKLQRFVTCIVKFISLGKIRQQGNNLFFLNCILLTFLKDH